MSTGSAMLLLANPHSEGAHFLQVKWSATKTALMMVLIVALSSFEPLQAAPSQPLVQQQQQQQQQQPQPQPPQQVGATSASASASATFATSATPQLNRRLAPSVGVQRPPLLQFRQQELENVRSQLARLESEPSDTLAGCANWYQLNQRLNALSAGRSATRPPRDSELRKRAECDNLERFYAETRAKLASFRQLLSQQNEQLDFAVNLTNEFLDLKYAASLNQQLSNEFEAAKNSDSQTRFRTGQLEQFLQFMASSLAPQSSEFAAQGSAPQTVLAAGPEARSADWTMASSQQQPQQPDEVSDELTELDAALKQLINKELSLNSDELSQLLELGNMLERILADGHVDVSSGRFRYLMGTLDAVHAVILHRQASPGALSEHELRAPLEPAGQQNELAFEAPLNSVGGVIGAGLRRQVRGQRPTEVRRV